MFLTRTTLSHPVQQRSRDLPAAGANAELAIGSSGKIGSRRIGAAA